MARDRKPPAQRTARGRDGDAASSSSSSSSSSSCKHQRTDAPSSRSPAAAVAAAQDGVFTVELLTQKIFSCLDASSVVRFASFLRSRDAWRLVLSDEKLWGELVTLHFGGRVPVPSPPPPRSVFSDEDSDEDDDGDDNDDDDEDDDGEDDDDGAGAQTPAVVNGIAVSGRQTDSVPKAVAPATLTLPVPEFACQSLAHFARSARQRQRFDDAVHVISGDIGTIAQINGQRIDGIAFATSGFLHNPYMGAAAVVFQRAGRDLDHHVSEIAVQIDAGEVHVTPGFASGVERLIHCAGPAFRGGRGVPLLAQTYANVMDAAVRESLQCVAMTSISTGNLGFPVSAAAATGLRALQRFIREHAWTGTIGIVCYEVEVFDAFTREKQSVLDAFNATV